jgi:hypothetical protein
MFVGKSTTIRLVSSSTLHRVNQYSNVSVVENEFGYFFFFWWWWWWWCWDLNSGPPAYGILPLRPHPQPSESFWNFMCQPDYAALKNKDVDIY